MRVWLDLPAGCVRPDEPLPPYQGELVVMNSGASLAPAFDAVAAAPVSARWAYSGLPPGSSYTRPIAPDIHHVILDPDDRVPESDEDDNDIYYGVPTPPPYCPTATPTPIEAPATATPTATAMVEVSTPGHAFIPIAVVGASVSPFDP